MCLKEASLASEAEDPCMQGLFELLGNTEDAFFVVDPNQNIIVWNKAAEAVLGLAAGDVIGKPCFEVFGARRQAPGYQCAQDCSIMLAARSGSIPETEMKCFPLPDGRVQHVRVTHIGIPLGRPHEGVALAHVLHDTTQDVEARAVVERMREYVRQFVPDRAASRLPYQSTGPLSHRELEILELLAEGLNTDALARCLKISRFTVRNHIQRILDKLGVHSRTAAVMADIRLSLTRTPQDKTPASPKNVPPPARTRAVGHADR